MHNVASPETRHEKPRWAIRLRRIPIWVLVFGAFSLTGLLQFAAVDWSRPLSIYDEVPHVDYVLRLADGQVTTWDSVYSQRTLGIAECLETQSGNPQCISERLRNPQDRWPNGYSYEALQAPLGYLPFVATELAVVSDQADHYSQIRQLRFANVAIFLAVAGLWAALVLQVTNRRLPAIAASVVVALNPLLFDRFTYVTNDGMAIAAAVGTAVWLLYSLRTGRNDRWWSWLVPALLIGLILGWVKPTAMIVLVPIALAVVVGRLATGRAIAPARWWGNIAAIAAAGIASSLAYQAYINARSQLDLETVLSIVLPRGPLDLATASLLRITDVSELVIGTGARTELTPYEWGVRSPSVWIVLFAIAGAAAFLASFALRTDAFPRQPHLDPRIWGYAVLAGFLAMLIAHPALHYVRDGFLMPFTAGRFQAPLIPLAGLALLPAFQRFRKWAWATIIAGLLIAAFASAPIDAYLENFRFLL